MKSKKISKTTTNRGEFNRAYKFYLEQAGKISCTYCRYHRNENGKGRGYYGGYERTDGHIKIIYPNWKLVSKNKKQWMDKPTRFKIRYYGGYTRKYIDITW